MVVLVVFLVSLTFLLVVLFLLLRWNSCCNKCSRILVFAAPRPSSCRAPFALVVACPPKSCRVSIAMLLGAILLPFQLALLLVLHAVFAFSRFIALVRQLPQLWPPSRSPAPPVAEPSPEQLAQDRSRWKKTPGHLAVSFVPGQQLLGSWRRSKQTREAHELAKLVEGLRLLLGWCEQLGIAELSVYDEQGAFERLFS